MRNSRGAMRNCKRRRGNGKRVSTSSARTSPLAAWLEYVNGSVEGEPLHLEALDGARKANSRQADAAALLDDGADRSGLSISGSSISPRRRRCARPMTGR